MAQADLAGSAPLADQLAEPTEAERRALVEGFAAAIDIPTSRALAELLRADAVLEMLPPLLSWFAGRDPVVRFVAANLLLEPAA